MKIKGSSAKPLLLMVIGAVVLYKKLGLSKISVPSAFLTTDAFFFFDNDFYGALALPFDAPSTTIKIAHESLNTKYDPKNSHYKKYKPEAMQKIAARYAEIEQAYEVLNEKTRRRAYVAFVRSLPRDWRPSYDSNNYSSSGILGIAISVLLVLLTAFSGLELAAFTQEKNDILKSKQFLKAQAKANAKGKSNEDFLVEYTSTEKPELEYGAADTILARLVLWPFKLVGIVSVNPSSADIFAASAVQKKLKETQELEAAKQEKNKKSRDRRSATEAKRTARAESAIKVDRARRRGNRIQSLTNNQLQALYDTGAVDELLPELGASATLPAQKKAWLVFYIDVAESADWTIFDLTLEAEEAEGRSAREEEQDEEQEARDEEQRKATAQLYEDDDEMGDGGGGGSNRKRTKNKKKKKSARGYATNSNVANDAPALLASQGPTEEILGEDGEVVAGDSEIASEQVKQKEKEEDEWGADEAAAALVKLEKKENAKKAKAIETEKNRLLNEERKKQAKEMGSGGGKKGRRTQ